MVDAGAGTSSRSKEFGSKIFSWKAEFDALLWVPVADFAEGQLCQWWRDVLLYCVVCPVERICSMPKQHSV